MSTSTPRKRKKIEGIIVPPVGPRQTSVEEGVVIPRSFLRLSKLTSSEFRVLLNGLTYNKTKFSVKVCARNIGWSERSVNRALKQLREKGYAYYTEKGTRFRLQPMLPDEQKPWYEDMMRLNGGDVDGLINPGAEDDGSWKRENAPSSRKVDI